MGADFKEKTRLSFQKAWDRAALEANTPDLFKKISHRAPRRFEADQISGAIISMGETICIRAENGKLVGRRGLSPVLTISYPTLELTQSIIQGCSVAQANVVSIDAVSGVVEITIK